MSDNNNSAKTMYEAVPAAAELNKVPGFDPLKFLRRAGDSIGLTLSETLVPNGTPQRAYASDGHEDHRADGDFRGQGISGPQ